MVAGVPEHGHCEICGKTVTLGERWCTTKCEEEHDRLQSEKKKFIWKQVALIAAVMLALTAVRMGWI